MEFAFRLPAESARTGELCGTIVSSSGSFTMCLITRGKRFTRKPSGWSISFSEKLEDRRAAKLGNPETDPHGHPIPEKGSAVKRRRETPLSK